MNFGSVLDFSSDFGLIFSSEEIQIRILITGSRDWLNPFVIAEAIEEQLDVWTLCRPEDERTNEKPVIVHGDCPTGADHWADLYAKACGYEVERYPADWALFGKFAGPKRNMEMVDTKPDVVLSFPKGLSKGTRGCTKYAQEKGLKVIIYEGDEYDIS